MNEYQRRVIEGRKQFLQLQAAQEKEILNIYQEAAKQITKDLAKSKDGSLNQRYLKAMQQSIRVYTAELNAKLTVSVKNNMMESIKISTGVQLSFFDQMDLATDLSMSFNKMFTMLNHELLQTLISGAYYDDGKSLNNRIWNITQRNAKAIDQLIKVNVAKGVNARELASQLNDYINSKKVFKAKTIIPGFPSSISYQAQRLARTSLTHANNEAYIAGAKKNPFSTGLKWNLSASHFERQVKRWGPDICDDYAGNIYKPDDYPVAHPNCLCFPTQAVVNQEEARGELIAWVNGEDNPALDTWLNDYGAEFGITK